MKPIQQWMVIGRDMVAVDAQGRAVGLLRWMPINPAHEKRSASNGLLERLNHMPSTNAIRDKVDSTTILQLSTGVKAH